MRRKLTIEMVYTLPHAHRLLTPEEMQERERLEFHLPRAKWNPFLTLGEHLEELRRTLARAYYLNSNIHQTTWMSIYKGSLPTEWHYVFDEACDSLVYPSHDEIIETVICNHGDEMLPAHYCITKVYRRKCIGRSLTPKEEEERTRALAKFDRLKVPLCTTFAQHFQRMDDLRDRLTFLKARLSREYMINRYWSSLSFTLHRRFDRIQEALGPLSTVEEITDDLIEELDRERKAIS